MSHRLRQDANARRSRTGIEPAARAHLHSRRQRARALARRRRTLRQRSALARTRPLPRILSRRDGPRRVRLTSLYYRVTWRPWRAFCLSIKMRKRREALLSVYGPLSLLALLSLWAVTLIFSFALLHWALGTELQTPDMQRGFGTYLYMSGVT